MTWLNEYEVEEAARLFKDHPVLGPATQTLVNLVDVANRYSDGWPYWQAPSKAAGKLQTLIRTEVRFHHLGGRYQGAGAPTAADVKAAYTPIKSFLTRHQFTSDVVVAL
jgi:hypothetical protein